MIIANDMKKILKEFDFTDSIVTEARLSETLLDLEVTLSYYWDIQQGRDK